MDLGPQDLGLILDHLGDTKLKRRDIYIIPDKLRHNLRLAMVSSECNGAGYVLPGYVIGGGPIGADIGPGFELGAYMKLIDHFSVFTHPNERVGTGFEHVARYCLFSCHRITDFRDLPRDKITINGHRLAQRLKVQECDEEA